MLIRILQIAKKSNTFWYITSLNFTSEVRVNILQMRLNIVHSVMFDVLYLIIKYFVTYILSLSKITCQTCPIF